MWLSGTAFLLNNLRYYQEIHSCLSATPWNTASKRDDGKACYVVQLFVCVFERLLACEWLVGSL